MSDYRPMWTDLGMDLERHDTLLNGLAGLFGSMFPNRERRPRAMGYFDFVVGEAHGLRIRELVDARKAGAKVVGTYCVFVPEELILAAGAIPIGLCAGTSFAVPDGEAVLPRTVCPLIKSSLGFKLNRTCPYVQASDLIVGETTCDGKKKMYELLAEKHETYVLEVPQKKTPEGTALFEAELGRFLARLEKLAGRTVSAGEIERQIRRIEAKKQAMRRLQALRRGRPAPISGLDALLVNQVSFYDDVDRFTQKVNELCDELDARVERGEGVAPAGAPRVLIAGSPMALPNWRIHHLIESTGAVVVGEESCVGSRYFDTATPGHEATLESQIGALARRQLDTHCACFTPNAERLEDIARMARELEADGVIHYGLQFCQPYAVEAVKVERALKPLRIPVLRVEDDYGADEAGQLRTRVQAFIEVLRAR